MGVKRRALAAIGVAVAAGLLIDCSSGGGSGDGGFPWAPLAFPTNGPAPTTMTLVPAFPGLAFAQPLFLTPAPDDTARLFVVERGGRIRVFADDAMANNSTVFLDIGGRVDTGGSEEGLLGLAFDPDYRNNGRFYVNYTASGPDRSVIARYTVTTDPDVADPGSEVVLLQVAQPASNHNGGMLAFGPDGLLYASLGDGGGGGDPWRNGQDKTTLLGSLLRIDPNGSTNGLPYGIPGDNPFVGEGGGVREEIWAYGLRNPWRFSFDRQTGELWLGDVGQGDREEIDVIVKGGNYGWPVYEGNREFDNPNHLPPSAFRAPVIDYPRNQAQSITGGYVYRGSRLPELRGAYLHGDFVSGKVWATVAPDGQLASNTEIATLGGLSSFGEDRQGELLLLSYSLGTIWKLDRAQNGGGVFPTRLSATGLFTDTASLTLAPGVVEYSVASPLWSDGASKRRWIVLPRGSAIDFRSVEAWTFPPGTALIKHFEIETMVGDPATRRRLETRVLLREAGGWSGYVYRWDQAQTDADLLLGAEEETLTIIDPQLGTRQQRWTYPSRTDCIRCHTPAAGFVLGVGTLQLNHEVIVDGAARNQLEHWSSFGALRGLSVDPNTLPRLVDPHGNAPLADRARSYLDANCAMCHRPGGPTPVDIDLRFATPDAATNLRDVRPTRGDLGLIDAWRVKTGVKESSVLWERLRRLDATRMPPLASHFADARALQLIGEWID